MVTIHLPKSVIQNHAKVWPAYSPWFVLNEEVIDWLRDHDISLTIDYFFDDTPFLGDEDGDPVYTATFNDAEDVTMFVMRWGRA